MNQSTYLIIIPILAGLLLLLFPGRLRILKGIIALVVTLSSGYLAVGIYIGREVIRQSGSWINQSGLQPVPDNLSRLILLFTLLLSILIVLYTLAYRARSIRNFHAWFLLTLGFTSGAILANNLLLFMVCWGILGITLYLMVNGNSEGESATAKKTLIMIGASDGIMILGIAIIWRLTGTLNMDEISLGTTDAVRVTAFLALLVGSFTKAGAFPFHSWIPDYAEHAPSTSSAYLPASLDKLLGIYFLARITTGLFIPGEWMRLIILSIGVITIITSVMMALVQHDYKRLLGFHAVSQVGYMVVGFGLGTLIGIAGGLFHMINHAIYKSGLFLTAGSVEQQTGKSDMEDLGGLSKAMPVTFLTAVVFALSISGIPPFNGFASKWMIYQGIIDFGTGAGIASRLWVIWLGLAVLGSALTLASFIKFTGGIFLGRRREEFEQIREVSPVMWIPAAVLALACIGFGVFASNLVIPGLFIPVTGAFQFTGVWASSAVGILVMVSIFLGLLVYLVGGIKNVRVADSFVGGEGFQNVTSYSTLEFYKSFQEFGFLGWMYRKARAKWFDLYHLLAKFFFFLGGLFSRVHSGILHDYIIWVLAGLLILLTLLIT